MPESVTEFAPGRVNLIGEQLVITGVGALDAVVGGVPLCGLALTAGDGEDLERG